MSLATLKMIDDARNKLCAESLKRDGQYFVEEEV